MPTTLITDLRTSLINTPGEPMPVSGRFTPAA